ncbi:AAA family ATPase [Rhodococcus zopfii]|uniref:AAA family ATPase n=1 Tax=Rhodococcus zopfii TaxID=43772 RepID=A0ABU3WQX1_9NOCA|nr:AAA family ATPase [Rhodococcus zopfii]
MVLRPGRALSSSSEFPSRIPSPSARKRPNVTNATSALRAHQSRNSKEYKRISPEGFVQSAKELVALGWHPIPLSGPVGKVCGPRGVQGREGVDVSDESTFREWADKWAVTDDGLNLGTRMPVGVIALDVDCYGNKPGAETMAACVEEWGHLPPTWSITARKDGSSKLLYRVPDDWEGRGILGPGVEVLQRHHRYAVVPPSLHDVGPVKVYGPDGEERERLPRPEELPMLPEAWCDSLHKFRQNVSRDRTADPDELLASFPDGLMTDAVQKAMQKVLEAISSRTGRHDALNDRLLELLRLGWGGATGVPLAVDVLKTAFVQGLGAERGVATAQSEFARSLKGAAEIVAAAGPSVAHAFQPGGVWHSDSRWVSAPEGGGVLRRGMRDPAGDEPPILRFATVSARDLAQAVPPMEWLVRGVWPRKSFGPMGGEKKTLKTYNLLAIALAVAGGAELFGEFEVESPGPVIYYVGEGGRAPFQRRAQAIARAYGVDLADLPLHAVFEVGSLDSPEFTDALKRNLDAVQPELVILDPLYAFHPAGVEAQNLYERGRMLAELSAQTANETALIVADHFRKSGAADLDLDSIAQSGMGQWADSWILQKHRETAHLDSGTYRLAVEFGSRQWGGSRWELDWQLASAEQVENGDEGDAAIGWEIRRADGNTGDRKKVRTRGGSGKRSEILEVVNASPFTYTKTQLIDAVGGNKSAVRAAIQELEDARQLVVKDMSAREGAREVERPRYGPGPGSTFKMGSFSGTSRDDDA